MIPKTTKPGFAPDYQPILTSNPPSVPLSMMFKAPYALGVLSKTRSKYLVLKKDS